jgi:hypothetical protein
MIRKREPTRTLEGYDRVIRFLGRVRLIGGGVFLVSCTLIGLEASSGMGFQRTVIFLICGVSFCAAFGSIVLLPMWKAERRKWLAYASAGNRTACRRSREGKVDRNEMQREEGTRSEP